MKWLLASLVLLAVLFTPAVASADDGRKGDGVLMRITGDVTVAKDQVVSNVVVIDGTVTVDGTVQESLTVISGTAIVNGSVHGDITVISGTLDLRSGAQVASLNLIDSDLVRADGVTVTGAISQHDGIEVPTGLIAALSVYFWLALTATIIAAGLVFAGIGGRQLNGAAQVMTGDPLNALLGGVFLWIGLPIVAVIAMLTLVGIPFGLGILLVALPALWFLGYIVAGAWLGNIILRRDTTAAHPLLATALGVLLLQLGLLVPVVGAVVAFLAGAWGAAALTYLAFRAAGGKGFKASGASPMAPGSTTVMA
jgi:hypothetical protein